MLYTQEEVEELLATQRGNCYVAILNETNDAELAEICSKSPEPGQWKERKTQTTKQIREIVGESLETLDDLSKLLDERVVDLHQVKGGMQSRHAYMFYRSKVWETKSLLQKIKSIV